MAYKQLNELPDSGVELLCSTVYGSKGLRLKHLDVRKKLKELIEPEYHVMEFNGNVVAVVAFCRRNHLSLSITQSYYIRYFSVARGFQQKGLGKHLIKLAVDSYKERLEVPTLVYAYIEGQNVSSISVSNHFEPQINSSFKTVFFSRFFPKKQKNCRRINKEELKVVEGKVVAHNGRFISFHCNRVGYENDYFILERNNQIMAGVQVIETNWEIENNPGFKGFLVQNILSKIPVLKKVIQGEKIHFLAIEAVFYEDVLDFQKLLEHVLHEKHASVAFLYFDIEDKRLKEIENQIKLGLLSKIQKSPKVNILHFGWKLNAEQEDELNRVPNYISAYDIT